jgi:beta-glucosidase
MATGSLPATCFPTASALASTWDVDLVYQMGQALADECIAIGVDVLLGPGNNMKRTPLCGRNFEYFSEDPCLSGDLAASLINGVQSKGIGTSLKHFAVNNQETQRMTISAEVDARTLHEVYLAGFRRAIDKSNPWTVMCSYNRINGTHASEHRELLTDILRDQWGYEGVMVSDWGGVHDRVKALEAGLDLEMPGPQDDRVRIVVEAIKNGSLDETHLNRSVERILELVAKASQTAKKHTTIDVEAHHVLSRRIAAEAIVLLKNEGNILPLKDPKTIAVIGAAAQQPHFQGGGSSHINAAKVDVPIEKLKKLAGSADLRFAPGYTMEEGFDQKLIDDAVMLAADAEIALLYVALPPFKESEGCDRPDMDLTDQQVALIKAVSKAQPRSVVILNNGSPVAMRSWIAGVPAVLEAWLAGQAGGGAVADVLFGRVNPSGRLAETFPIQLSDTPAHINFPGENGKVYYGERSFIGYRYYDSKDAPVQFPFGFGLSYTSFELSNLRLSKKSIHEGEPLTVIVDVTNIGPLAGKETVQVYVRDVAASLMRPSKELKGFGKLYLEPGETKALTITLDGSSFTYYDPALGEWVAESGEFEILVGRSVEDIVLRESVTLDAHQNHKVQLHRLSTMNEWLASPRGAAVLESQLTTLFPPSATQENGPLSTNGRRSYVRDIPLETLLIWFGKELPMAPEHIVDQLLAEVAAIP